MENNKCQWCSKEFERKRNNYRMEAKFCSDECRYAYNNEMKRMKRQHDVLIAEALRLNENLARGGEMGQLAMKYIQALMPCLVSAHAVDISCSKCGQKRLLMPESWDNCSFCGENAWIVKPRQNLPAES